jgi:GTP-binding protein Era
VGQKIAITAPVPQTTRGRLSGILTLPDAQIAFVDTPPFHQPRNRLGEWMIEVATRALADADAVLFVLDAAAGVTPEDEAVVTRLGRSPAVAVLNKIDRLDASRLAAVEAQVRPLGSFAGIVPVSAATGANLDRLVQLLVGLLPEGPQYFPPEMVTDQPEQFLVRELIREQAIQLTREELPYGIAVEIEEFAHRSSRPGSSRPRRGQESEDLIYIRAILHVERDSHKKMLIGRRGHMLKAIGQRARREIEAILHTHVYLDLWVKTSKGWRERDDLVKALYPE